MRVVSSLCVLFLSWAVPLGVAMGEVALRVDKESISGPAAPAERDAWFEQMKSMRDKYRAETKYNGREYERPELLWTQKSFVQPQMMCEERYFYDPIAGKYTVDRYLDDLEKRYGGIDAVLIWPVYPNIGIDDRNQHDLLRDMPGGIPGLRKMIDDFHKRSVRVLFPVMPWDAGARDEGMPLWEAAAHLMKEIGADGLNGDTMPGLPREFRDASDKSGHILALEPEVAMADVAMVQWNTMSWGYWKYEPIPVVGRYKWLEPRHMVNVCERWALDRTNGLQSAFFNGVGYESWENVWGIWNQLTPRDAEALRRIRTIYRGVPDLLVRANWEPHVKTLQEGVYASRFSGKYRNLWLLVNRTDKALNGKQLQIAGGGTILDLWSGAPLSGLAALSPSSEIKATVSFEIEAHGYGAVLQLKNADPDEKLTSLLARMKELSKTRLDSLSAEWKPLLQKMVEIAPTKPAKTAPEGMVAIPAGKFRFKVSGVEIEGNDKPGVDVQYPWEDVPHRHHDKTLDMKTFYIDKYPVTNAEFKKFVDAGVYHPADKHNFLRDWKDGNYPEGWGKKPVTWVAIEDARAYAAWAGKRLPHEWEWQYAAQGTDERERPWGKEGVENATPKFEDGRVMPPPDDVDAHPNGASPFGVMDLAGNVWQWTSEFVDDHTRAGIVRGGSRYRPKASHWYFPRNHKLDQHGKYLLMAPSKDRSAGVGFRCVVDAE